MRESRSIPAAVVLALAWTSAARGADPSPDAIRALPPVLIKGETGTSIPERMRQEKVPAVSIAIIRDFKVVAVRAYGISDAETGAKATPDTLFQAGSISKPVAAAGALRKVEDGTLALDRDVDTYLKSWKLPRNELTEKRKVTLAMLLSHSAGTTVHGFPGYAAGEKVPTVPQVLDGTPPANTGPVRVTLEPGTKWRYSGGGYTIAQLVLTDATGRPFPSLLSDLVLGPAGMSHSTYEQPLPPGKLAEAAAGYRSDGSLVPGKRHVYPEMAAAGLWTTAGDLARFAVAIQKSVRGDAGSLLSKEMARRMVTPLLGDWALGFQVEVRRGEPYFQHDGSDEGFRALLVAHRDKGYGAAVMVNSDNGRILYEIARGVAREYGWAGYIRDPVEPVILPEATVRSRAGRYAAHGDDALILSPRGESLVGSQPFGEAFELVPVSETTFVRRDEETRYVFEPGKEGTQLVVEKGKERTLARPLPPDFKTPSELLKEEKFAEALAGWRAIEARTPDDPSIAEGRLNNLGYQLASRKDFAKAVAVLKANTELYPQSANTYDSLAEILRASGDVPGSLAASRKVLEALPKDVRADPALREQLRKNAEKNIRELSALPAK